jgi:hypothetical protein
MSIPEKLERREVRLAAMAEAKAKIEARAEERLVPTQRRRSRTSISLRDNPCRGPT